MSNNMPQNDTDKMTFELRTLTIDMTADFKFST